MPPCRSGAAGGSRRLLIGGLLGACSRVARRGPQWCAAQPFVDCGTVVPRRRHRPSYLSDLSRSPLSTRTLTAGGEKDRGIRAARALDDR
jgi:hypothetical protein